MHEDTEGERYGDHAAAEIVEAWFESSAASAVTSLAQGEPLRLVFEARFHERVEDPIFAFALRNEIGHTVFATSTQLRSRSRPGASRPATW